jgi:hypothetical protein
VGGEHLAERGDGIRRVGQAQRRAINGAQVETAPAPDWCIAVPAPNEILVQVDERAGLELLASGTKRALGDGTLGHIGITQNLKEVVQLALEGTLDQVQQEEKHDRK